MSLKKKIEQFSPGDFENDHHFYPKALNAQIHPLVGHFFQLNQQRLISRYCHLHPQVDPKVLKDILSYQPKYFYWGGSDLFYVVTQSGVRKMVVLETNSCPSGQKSFPPKSDDDEHRGYRHLIEKSFLPQLKKKRLTKGALAVIYDKNYMECSGYAATLADLTNEKIYLVPFYDKEQNHIRFEDGLMIISFENQDIPIRAALRYVTQKPWDRIPVLTKTWIYNPVLACLAGGRNKLVASKAYELYNSELMSSHLQINIPQTIRDVSKLEIPLWVERFGGFAVVKNPYSNAGQGVYTITSKSELEQFMSEPHDYDQFIVQSLIGHYDWSSRSDRGMYYHIGTVPNKRNQIFVADLRMMIIATPEGIRPVALYARRTRRPLIEKLEPDISSWEVLGTNLSVKVGESQWDSDTSRLVLMDRKEFNTLGIGVDDLIEAFIQSSLCLIAIDKMAKNLINQKGQFKSKLFQSLDNDKSLIKEIMII